MGQYFNPVIVDPTGRPLAALNPATYGAGPKLSTHTRADSPLMTAVEILLTLDGGARLVWAGDYEDPDDDQDALYCLVEPQHFVCFAGLIDPDEPVTPNAEAPAALPAHRYICNPDKRQYLDKDHFGVDDYGIRRSPLPWLTAEGGLATQRRHTTWARDRIY
jgi:hypothetical protein